MRSRAVGVFALFLITFGVGSFPRAIAPQAPQAAQVQEAPEYGPAKGTLVIVGGGQTDGTGIVEKFIQLAGGPDAHFVIVPTAGGNRNQDGSLMPYKEEDVIAAWLKRGLKNVKMLHTADPEGRRHRGVRQSAARCQRACGSTAAASGTSSTRTRTR